VKCRKDVEYAFDDEVWTLWAPGMSSCQKCAADEGIGQASIELRAKIPDTIPNFFLVLLLCQTSQDTFPYAGEPAYLNAADVRGV
jgi:hypothetical protein